jgi:hypothetical protein
MQEKNILLCFLALPLRHKLVAAGIVVAIASGFFALSRHARPATTAAVSFDVGTARQVEPTVMQAKEPAVVLAQSILTDEAASGLAKRTGEGSKVAEFRSRLQMTQRGANLLELNYRDGDEEISAATANAVANLLVAWKPTPVFAAPPMATFVAVSEAAPVRRSHSRRQRSGSKSDEMRALEAQLVEVDRKLAALDAAPGQTSALRKAETSAHVSNADNEQRRGLEAQLSGAQKKLEDLRLRYTDEYPDVEAAKENVAELQQQLAALAPVSRETAQSAITPKPEGGSSEVNQLRVERGGLVQAIAEEKRHPTGLRDHTSSVGDAPAPSPVQAQPAPVRQPVDAVAPFLQSPFTLVRLASDSEPGAWWHGVLAGILCGFLYLSSAVWRYLPVAGGAPSTASAANSDAAVGTVGPVEMPTDLAGWEKEIKKALAETEIGRQEEPLIARLAQEEGANDEQQVVVCSPEVKGQLHYDEVSEAIRAKVKREPNSWMAHTEQARLALAGGDYDTAIKEIKVAMTVAPEKMRPKLDKIVAQLDRTISVKQRAAFG